MAKGGFRLELILFNGFKEIGYVLFYLFLIFLLILIIINENLSWYFVFFQEFLYSLIFKNVSIKCLFVIIEFQVLFEYFFYYLFLLGLFFFYIYIWISLSLYIKGFFFEFEWYYFLFFKNHLIINWYVLNLSFLFLVYNVSNFLFSFLVNYLLMLNLNISSLYMIFFKFSILCSVLVQKTKFFVILRGIFGHNFIKQFYIFDFILLYLTRVDIISMICLFVVVFLITEVVLYFLSFFYILR